MGMITALRTTVVAPMRNEGPFIVEWVSWYRMLGFSEIVVLTNDCTDHSEALLDAFAAAGWLHHQRCVIPQGQSIYRCKMDAAMALRPVRRANWVMVCDADEFLVIHRGHGKLADLLADGPSATLGMAINWRVFGNNDVTEFADLPVTQQFFGALAKTSGMNSTFKTIHTHPRWFDGLGDHAPVKLDIGKAQAETGLTWGQGALHWANAAGKRLDWWTPGSPYIRRLPPEDCDFSVAQLNHYMLRSAETFSLKQGAPSPSALKDRYTDGYWDRANEVTEIDTSVVRMVPEFDGVRAAAMALPDVAALHYACCADHVALIAEKAGRRADDDPRYGAFLAAAAAAQG